MGKFRSILTLVSIFLINCSAPEQHPVADVVPVPERLNFIPPEKGQKLTSSDAEEIRSKIGSKAQVVIPDLGMVFTTSRFRTAEVTQKELELKQKSPASHALIKDIQQYCLKDRPTTKMNATFPTDTDISVGNLNVNDQIKVESSALLYGEGCPINFTGRFSGNAQVQSSNYSKSEFSARGNAFSETHVIVQSSKYAEIFNSKGLLINSSLSGLDIRQDVKNNTLLQYRVNGTYLSLDNSDIPFQMDAKTLLKKTDGKDTEETVVKMTMQWSKKSIRIDMHKDVLKNRYFVNGYEISVLEFEQMFGVKSPIEHAPIKITSTFRVLK